MFARLVPIAVAICAALAAAPAVAAPSVERLCTTDQGFGYRFGEPIAAPAASAFRANFDLGPDLLPFRRAEVMITEESRRVHRVNAAAPFGSDAEMRAFIVASRDSLRAGGWAPDSESEGLMADLSQVGLPLMDMVLQKGSGRDRRIVEIMTLGREVYVSCVAPELQREALREWLAPPPVGEARPQPPALPAAVAGLQPPTCSGADPVAAIGPGLERWMEQWQPYATAVSRHHEQLIEWSGQRLVRSGRWTVARKQEFERQLLERPEISASMQAVLQGSMQMLIDLSEVAELEQAGRQAEACARVVAMFERIPQIAALTARQSREIDGIYRAEAQKLGVSLE